jgi:multiple sugar transport system substrate-binding protein
MKRIVLILGILVILGNFISPEILIAAEKIKLTYWAVHRDDKTNSHRQAFVDKFIDANSNIDVEVTLIPFEQVLQKQVIAGAAGTLPDVFEVANEIQQRAAAGHAIPLDPYVDKEDIKDFLDGAVADATHKGKLYGIPIDNAGARLFLYNKDLFQKAGIKKFPETWMEYIETAKKFIDPSKGIYGGSFDGAGMMTYNNFFQYVAQAGGSILNKDWTKCTVNSPEGVKALQFWVDLIHTYKVVNPNTANLDFNENVALFAAGKIAMMDGFARWGKLATQINPNVQVGYMAMIGDKKRVAFGSTWNLVVSKNSKHPKAAFELIEILTSKERMLNEPAFMPTRKSMLSHENWKKIDPEIRKNLAYMKSFENTPVLSQMIDILSNSVREALLLKSTPKEALDKAASKIDVALAKR